MACSRAALSITIGALAVVSAMGLSAVVGAGPQGIHAATGPIAAALVVTDAIPIPSGVVATPLGPSAPLLLTFTLAGPNPSGLNASLQSVEDPFSPAYRQFLTVSQYESEFAPTASTVDSVVSALESAGARDVTIAPGRLAVTAVAAASTVHALLGVTPERIGGTPAAPVYTTSGNVRLPAALSGRIVGIGGLSNAANPELSYELARTATVEARSDRSPDAFIVGNPPTGQWLLGSDFTQAYGASTLFPANASSTSGLFPTHVAVATLLAGGYNESVGANLPPWDPAVLGWYLNHTLAPWWPVSNLTGVPVTVGGSTPPLPGTNGGLNDTSLDQVENSLDLEMVASLAPGAPVYNFYFAGGLLSGSPPWSSVADDFALDFSAALNYSYGAARLGVISGSFGLPDLNDSLWDADLAEAALTGVTVVAASGDQANAPNNVSGRPDGPWPTWPGSASFDTAGTVAVGGVTLSLAGAPAGNVSATGLLNLTYDRNVTGIASMSTWYDTTAGRGNYEGSEGGVSTVYPEPGWQFVSTAGWPIVNATVLEGLGSVGRAEPDVAFPANGTLAMYGANATNVLFYGAVVEGTSIAAPVFAGLLADMIAVKSGNSVASWSSFGFLDPELYRIGSFFGTHDATAQNPYLAVTVGNNYVFSAGPGWNPTAGWGGFAVPRFLAADSNRTVADFIYTGPTHALPPAPATTGLPWEELYLVVGGGLATAVVLVLLMARPRRSSSSGGVPPGARGASPPGFGPEAQGGIYPGATFLCPYCGAVRPAEPVRCPQCGAF